MQELTKEQVRYIQENFKVPVDRDIYPQQYWVISLSVESEMPSDAELRQLRSFIEFKMLRGIYDPSFGQRVRDKPLPLVPGHNTLIFRKVYGDNTGWCYRRASWEIGPTFVPWTGEKDFHPHSLVEVIDRDMKDLVSIAVKWTEWKSERPDIFPVAK